MEERNSRRLHILAVPFPAQSHISALMKLCERIAAAGSQHELLISFVNVDSIHEQMVRHSARIDDHRIRLESLPFQWKIPAGYDAYCVANRGLFAEISDKLLPPELEVLSSRLSREISPVCCILSDYFLPWTQRVADKLGVPRLAFWSGSASWSCIEFHIPELTAKKHIFQEESEDCLVDYIGGIPPILMSDLPAYLSGGTDELWPRYGQERSASIRAASWVLVNSFYSLEKRAFDFMRGELGDKFVPVGPLSSSSSRKSKQTNDNDNQDCAPSSTTTLRAEDERCLAWLETQPPRSVLYISFGSIAVLSQAQFEELAGALAKCKETPFLWVVRPELVVGGLDDGIFSAFRDSVGERGLVVSWAPQLQVLAHPSVGGFLTHCGWNSMLESISNGVPMLGWPWAGEQNTNSRLMVDDWKIGAEMPVKGNEVVRQEEIVRVIQEAMATRSDELRKRVQQLKDAAAKAIQEADEMLLAVLDELAGHPRD